MHKFKKVSMSKILVVLLGVALMGFAPLEVDAQSSRTQDSGSRFQSQNETRFQAQNKDAEQAKYASLYKQIIELQQQLLILLQLQRSQNNDAIEAVDLDKSSNTRSAANPYFVQLETLSPLSVDRTVVELQAEVDKGSSKFAETWFQYGKNKQLNKKTQTEEITATRRLKISDKIFNLEPDTKYSYRVVVEDQKGNRQYGKTRTLFTPDSAMTVSFTGRPLVETEGVEEIRSTSAELKGFVSMNDYEDGLLFFVYGTSLRDINDVEDYDTYEEVRVVRGEMNKAKTRDRELFNGRDVVRLRVSGLQRATKNYYRVCVEYRDGGDAIRCGDSQSFVTSNSR
jgi:hypothetical protein